MWTLTTTCFGWLISGYISAWRNQMLRIWKEKIRLNVFLASTDYCHAIDFWLKTFLFNFVSYNIIIMRASASAPHGTGRARRSLTSVWVQQVCMWVHSAWIESRTKLKYPTCRGRPKNCAPLHARNWVDSAVPRISDRDQCRFVWRGRNARRFRLVTDVFKLVF